MDYLTPEFLKDLNREIIAKTGGTLGSVNEGNLYHACMKLQSHGKDVISKAAQFLHFMAFRAHAFTDGNKRTALAGCATFLRANGYPFDASEEELIGVTLLIASGNMAEEDAEKWIRKRVKKAKA